MKRYRNYQEEEREETNHWMPVSNILAAVLLVFVMLFVLWASRIGNLQQPVQGAQDNGSLQAKENGQNAGDVMKAGSDGQKSEQAVQPKQFETDNLSEIRAGITAELIDKLSGLNMNLDIDRQTGTVRFSEALYFDINRRVINQAGKAYLDKFVPAYLSVLFSDNNRKYIDQIIIEGHSDDFGAYLYNLDLSQKRAYEVANHIFRNKLVKIQGVKSPEKYFAVSGRSYGEPVMVNGAVDKQKYRRVEFEFRLKGDDTVKAPEIQDKGAE